MTPAVRKVYAAWLERFPGRGGADLEELLEEVERVAVDKGGGEGHPRPLTHDR